MLKQSEAKFWRSIGWILGIVLVICVVVNSIYEEAIPHQITLLLFGCLVALGVGNTVVNPGTSAVKLSEEDETRFRRNQYIVGFIVSTILVLLMVFTELGKSALAWLFAPIIVLPYALVIRARLEKE